MRNNIRTYQNINVVSAINSADPHSIISMLFDGIFKSVSIAKGAINRKEFEVKSKELNKAMSILRSLQDSLDMESEPEISTSFNDLYTYCIERLTQVSVSLDCGIIDEVVDLLKPLADAWKNIPESDKEEGHTLLKSKVQVR
jgi:flagellar protein FliS